MPTHYTPIPSGSGVANTSTVFNSRFDELDTAIVNVETGVAPLTMTKYSTPSTLTLSANVSGVITVTKTRHYVDTFASASSGDLVTINGGVDGQLLILQSVNSGRVVSIKRTGNVYFPNNADAVLVDPKNTVTLIYDGTSSKWIGQSFDYTSFKESLGSSYTTLTQVDVPDRTLISSATSTLKRLAFMPNPEVTNSWGVQASAATIVARGMALPTIANSPTNANDNNTVWTAFPTTNLSGNIGGFVSTTFNLIRRDHNPVFTAVVQTPSSLGSPRYWIGLGSADATNSDTASGHFVGFRYSSVAGDTAFKAVTRDGSTQATSDVGATVATSTKYVLRCRVDSTNSTAYFSVNGSTEVAIATNLPASGTDLGLIFRVITNTAAIITLNLSRLHVEGA